MKILAFETSCDDTAVAVVQDGCRVLSSVRVSQVEHEAWGGVVPEIAARLHAEAWRPVLEQALLEAELTMEDIDYLACTHGPGLQTSLLTGTTVVSFLSQLYEIPLLPVHHVYGHLCSVFLEREDLSVIARQKNERGIMRQSRSKSDTNPPSPLSQGGMFPALVLTASGGHTELYLWKNAFTWQKLGQSLDDAVGEAFDKVAKMLGLGYPGGPIVAKRAALGDRKKYALPIPQLGKESLDFSFSGVKAAVRRLVEQEYPELLEAPPSRPHLARGEGVRTAPETGLEVTANGPRPVSLTSEFIDDVCASFEFTVGQIFTKKLKEALEQQSRTKTVCFVGGVSANTYVNKIFTDFLQQHSINYLRPAKIEYSTDNAAMIAGAAYWQLQKDLSQAKVRYVEAVPRLTL